MTKKQLKKLRAGLLVAGYEKKQIDFYIQAVNDERIYEAIDGNPTAELIYEAVNEDTTSILETEIENLQKALKAIQ